MWNVSIGGGRRYLSAFSSHLRLQQWYFFNSCVSNRAKIERRTSDQILDRPEKFARRAPQCLLVGKHLWVEGTRVAKGIKCVTTAHSDKCMIIYGSTNGWCSTTPTWSGLVTQQLDDRSWVWNYHLCMPLCNSGSCHESAIMSSHLIPQKLADRVKDFEANADPTFRIPLPGSGARNPKQWFY